MAVRNFAENLFILGKSKYLKKKKYPHNGAKFVLSFEPHLMLVLVHHLLEQGHGHEGVLRVLEDHLRGSGNHLVRQALVLGVPVVDAGNGYHHHQRGQVLRPQDEVVGLDQVAQVPGEQAARLLLLHALEVGLQLVVSLGFALQIRLNLADLFA